MARVLVTGGAGYIGSHIVRRLAEAGREVVVLDDLSEGHRAAVGVVPLIEGNLGDAQVLERVFGAGGISFVVHMAASCQVGESMTDPGKYYRNNVVGPLAMLDAARRAGVKGVVFSSTAAVYGEPTDLPISEEHACHPTNTYGETKLAFERALAWYQRAHGMRYAALRYFNAAGAHPDGDIGEDHAGESHLVPRLLQAVIDGGPEVPIFGRDYATSDGTCVRDYVHVVDLAEAHVLALQSLERGTVEAEAFNLGNGEGFSVNEVIETVARVTGARPPLSTAPRRDGDPAILVASAQRAQRRLGWSPRFPALQDIVATAWAWHRRHPRGYASR
jgi:UDP-glucose 4-epimerase